MRFSQSVCVYTCTTRAGERFVRRTNARTAAQMCANGEAVPHTKKKKLIESIRIVRTTDGLRRVGAPTGYRPTTTKRIEVTVAAPCCGVLTCPVCKGTGMARMTVPTFSREQRKVYSSDRWSYVMPLTDCSVPG